MPSSPFWFGPSSFLLSPNRLEQTAAFYQLQPHRHPEAMQCLERHGLRDPALIEELGIGYAPGGNLHRHLAAFGYSFESLLRGAAFTCLGRISDGQPDVPANVLLGMPARTSVGNELIAGVTLVPVKFTTSGVDQGAFTYT